MKLVDSAEGFLDDIKAARALGQLKLLADKTREIYKKKSQLTIEEIASVKGEIAPGYFTGSENDTDLYLYILKECIRKTPWTAVVLLVWLSKFHKQHAAEVYASWRMNVRPYQTSGNSRKAKKTPRVLLPYDLDSDAGRRVGDRKIQVGTATMLANEAPVLCASFTKQGDRVVSGTEEGEVYIWNAGPFRDGDGAQKLVVYKNSPVHASFSPDGVWIAVVEWGGSGGLFKSNARSAAAQITFNHEYRPTTVAFSPDGTLVVTAAWDGHVRIWSCETGSLLRTIPLPPLEEEDVDDDDPEDDRAVNSASFSPCGRYVVASCSECSAAAGYSSGFFHIWNAFTGEHVKKLVAHRSGGCSAGYSQSGRFIVTSGCDCSARLWDAANFERLGIFKGNDPRRHKDYVWHAECSPDETLLVTASGDGYVNIWDLESKAILAHLKHGGPVNMARFSPCGTKIVSACDDGYAYIWPLSFE